MSVIPALRRLKQEDFELNTLLQKQNKLGTMAGVYNPSYLVG
jgi:hypothetical protein